MYLVCKGGAGFARPFTHLEMSLDEVWLTLDHKFQDLSRGIEGRHDLVGAEEFQRSRLRKGHVTS